MGATAITAIATCCRSSSYPSPEPRLAYQNVVFFKQNILIDGIKSLRKSKGNAKGMFSEIKSKGIFFI